MPYAFKNILSSITCSLVNCLQLQCSVLNINILSAQNELSLCNSCCISFSLAAPSPKFALVRFIDQDDVSVVPLVNIQADEIKQGNRCKVKWSDKKLYQAEIVALG